MISCICSCFYPEPRGLQIPDRAAKEAAALALPGQKVAVERCRPFLTPPTVGAFARASLRSAERKQSGFSSKEIE